MNTHNPSLCYISSNRPGPQMGMGQYERLLLEHALSAEGANRWRFSMVFSGRSNGQRLEPARINESLTKATFLGYGTDRLLDVSWTLASRAMQMALVGRSSELYHSLALTCPVPHGARGVYTIHDLPPARFKDEGKVPVWAAEAARSAKAVITPSHFAKAELVELLGIQEHRVQVIPYGCEHDWFSPDVAPANQTLKAKLGVTGDYLIYAGGFTRRKNVAALMEAWKSVSARHPALSLVLAGPPQQLGKFIAAANVERVLAPGYMDRPTLAAMIKGSRAMVYPSIYEGFGLPPLEAMAMGVPVVAVRAGAIPEVVGEGGFLAPDGSPEALEATILEALASPDECERRIAVGLQQAQKFCWKRHALQVLDVYQSALND